MKQRLAPASFPASLPLVVFCGFAGALLSACLPSDPPVSGRLLRAGSDITNPAFVTINDEPWVLYEQRLSRPLNNRGGVVDLALVKWSDANQQRLLLAGRAERPEWPLLSDASGARFYVTDERSTPGALPVGSLHRVTLTEGIKETIPDVMTYSLGQSGRTFYYRRYIPGSPLAELHLRDIDGRDRNLGPVAPGQILLLGDETLYFIVGADRVLTRAVGFEGPMQPLRARVSQFQIGGGEKFGLLTVGDEGRPRTIVVDFATKVERPLPVDNPCCSLGFSDSTFTFADSAKPGQPAVLHTFDFINNVDRTLTMPEGLNDIVSIVRRPNTDENLIFDTLGNMALHRPQGTPVLQLLTLRPRAYQFSRDGKYFFYMVVDPPPPPPAVAGFPSGRLFVLDPDNWDLPPRLLSPVGASVPVEPKGYLVRDDGPYPLVFWARYGLGSSDLYLGDHVAGTNVLVANGIGEISVSHSQVLGVVNMSQDLTGELVYKDFVTGKQIVIERGVFEVEYLPDAPEIVFTVRERMGSSPRNGLWAALLPSPEDLASKAARFVPKLQLAFPQGAQKDSRDGSRGREGVWSPLEATTW